MDVSPGSYHPGKNFETPVPFWPRLGRAKIPGAGHYDRTHASRTACVEVKHRKLRSMFERVDRLPKGIIGRPTRSCHVR